MPLPTSQEPSTKFFGPVFGYLPPDPRSRILLQLHNLQPGQFWNPAWSAELHAPHVLSPLPGLPAWRGSTTHFFFAYDHWPPGSYWGPTLLQPQSLLNCMNWDTAKMAFWFVPKFGVNLAAKNEQVTSPGFYAINGTATISYYLV